MRVQGILDFLRGLEAKQLRVNWDKTGFLSSSKELTDALSARWTLEDVDRLVGTRCLGTDANDGSARRRWETPTIRDL